MNAAPAAPRNNRKLEKLPSRNKAEPNAKKHTLATASASSMPNR